MRNSSAQSFIFSASASAKTFHFGASLRSTGIKDYSLGITLIVCSSDQN